MIFARRVFQAAGAYGMLILIPLYALEGKINRDFPPAITHPEFYYGFLGVTLAWQLAFFLIAHDPERFRPIMVPAVIEKIAYGGVTVWLVAAGRTPPVMAGGAVLDLVLAALFVLAFLKTRAPKSGATHRAR